MLSQPQKECTEPGGCKFKELAIPGSPYCVRHTKQHNVAKIQEQILPRLAEDDRKTKEKMVRRRLLRGTKRPRKLVSNDKPRQAENTDRADKKAS